MVEWGSSSNLGDLGFPEHRMASADSIDEPPLPGTPPAATPRPSPAAVATPKPSPAAVGTPRPSPTSVGTPRTPNAVFSFMDPAPSPSTTGVAHEQSFSRNVKAKIEEPVISEEDALLKSAEQFTPLDILKKKTKVEQAKELKE